MTERLMRTLLAVLLAAGFALAALPEGTGAQGDDEVGAAGVIIDSEGDTGDVYLFDAPASPGVVCRSQAITDRLILSVTPLNVLRSDNGPDEQLVLVWVDAYEVVGDQYTIIDSAYDEARTDSVTGIAELGDPSTGFTIDAGYAGNVIVQLEVVWNDDDDEETGWAIIVLQHYDNGPIGGGISGSCQNDVLNPTPTAIAGAFAIGDMVRTTAGLNLRTGPGTNFPSIGVIPANTVGTVEGFPVISGGFTWYPVQFPSRPLGFVAGNWLTRVPNTPTPTATATQTATATATFTPTNTATATNTATVTNTPTNTATPTETPTHTPIPQMSPAVTATPTFTPTATLTPSRTPTRTPTTIPGGFAPGDHVRTTANVNLRSSPGTGNNIIATVPFGRSGVVTGFPTAANGLTWYPVQFPGYAPGFMAGSLLSKFTPTATATAQFTSTATRTPTQSPTTGPSPTGTNTRTATPTVLPGGFAPGDLVRTTGRVNLRVGPGANQTILATTPLNTNGTVTGFPTAADGFNWYPVQMNGFPAGFMAGDFLTKTGTAPTPTRTSTPGSAEFDPNDPVHVSATSLNLRSAAGTGATVIGQMPFGTNGTVTGAPVSANGFTWYPVSMFGFGSGWTAGEFLDAGVHVAEEEPVEAVSPESDPAPPSPPTQEATDEPDTVGTPADPDSGADGGSDSGQQTGGT